MTVIALVGPVGSGKTSTGRLVAKWTARDFIDVDAVGRDRTGLARRVLEEGDTEAHRRVESQVLLALDTEGDALLAVPGEALLSPRVRAEIGRVFVIWLRAQPAILAARVEGGAPTTDGHGLFEAVADLVIDTDTRDVDEVGRCIVQSLRAHGLD